MTRYLLALLALLACNALADTFDARVVGIADGDTITVLDAQKTQHKVRLAGIDAPEKGQSYGNASRKSLAALVHRKDVVVEWHKRDRYGRLVGKVLRGRQDVNLEQVRLGFAWHYKRYEMEQTAEDRRRYTKAENNARMRRVGLWQDSEPMPPWEWRTGIRLR